MAKVILVMDDMPADCFMCPCFCDVTWRCCATEKDEEVHDNRPSWCPLRQLPERMTADLYYGKTDYICDWEERSCGWNECLDEILGETE